jgi:hypothetical protein
MQNCISSLLKRICRGGGGGGQGSRSGEDEAPGAGRRSEAGHEDFPPAVARRVEGGAPGWGVDAGDGGGRSASCLHRLTVLRRREEPCSRMIRRRPSTFSHRGAGPSRRAKGAGDTEVRGDAEEEELGRQRRRRRGRGGRGAGMQMRCLVSVGDSGIRKRLQILFT